MFDELYPEASDVALTAKLNRAPEPAPAPSFSFWGMLAAAPKGVAAGAAQGTASGADMTKAIRDKVPANVSGPFGRIPIFNAITSVMQVGADVLNPKEGQFSSEAGDILRGVARDYTPDPQTTHAAEGAVFNLFRMGSKALTAGAMGGNIPGAVLAGAEEGFSMSADLAQQGVDVQTRTKVGAVNAAMNAAGFALPAAGKTWMQTTALALVGGPASFVAQNAATREILQSADYTKQAEQYDPFDPVGLALSTVLPLGFGALAMRGAKAKAVPDAAPPIHPPDDMVDAARVSLVRQHMDAANPVPDNLAGADAHVKAYEQAMEQMAVGERVRVDDVAPAIVPVAGKATDSPNFKAWFGDSKVAGADGVPLVMYHETSNAFDVFKDDRPIFVAFDRKGARMAASGGGKTLELFVRAENPANTPETPVHFLDTRKALRDNPAADSVYVEDEAGVSLALRSNTQVKSAIGNSGKFDPNSASLTDNPIADWGAGLNKALADALPTPKESPPNVQDQAPKASPDQAGTPAQGDGAAATDVPGARGPAVQADGVTFNPAALATEASRLLSDGRSPAEVIGNLEASGAKVTPELQNMLIGASEFGGRINDLVAQVEALKAQRGPNVQPFDLVAQAVDNMRNGVKAQAPDAPNPLEARLAEMTDRNPSALDAEIAVEFDANGKPTARTTLGEYLDQIKREAAQDAGDASLLEVAANCFLSGAT